MIGIGEFSLEVRLVRTAHAGTGRIERGAALLAELDIARLRHEAIDHAMEHDAIIGAFACEFLDPLDMSRREVRIKFDNDICPSWFREGSCFLGLCRPFSAIS